MSDLDNEELIATRKLHGLNDNLFKKINIEDNIKRSEQLTKPEHANWIGISNQMAIAGVLARIKELEEENTQLEAIKDEAIKKYNFESIPVQKVKDKIEEVHNMKFKDERLNSATIDFAVYKFKELLEEK